MIGRAAAGNSFQPIVLSGLRGVGKTVLLLSFRAHARDAVWTVELFEARPAVTCGPKSPRRCRR